MDILLTIIATTPCCLPVLAALNIRLTNTRQSDNLISGLLQVRLDIASPWGTVCDDEFDTNDAIVACKNLQYTGGSFLGNDASYRTADTNEGAIYMDYLGCSGSETELMSCTYRGWGIHSCSHAEDVVVGCTGRLCEAVSHARAWRPGRTT
jgi:hypothetical protein